MKIINAILSRKLGGMEQAALDYARALQLAGNEVVMLVEKRSPLRAQAQSITRKVELLNNRLGYADLPAVWHWWRLIKQHRPDAIVAHGNRAVALALKAAAGTVPVVAVNHTDNQKRSLAADAVICVNPKQRDAFLKLGYVSPEKVAVVPNMVVVPEAPIKLPSTLPAQPVIGTLARLSREKGVDVLLEALALLHQRGIAFRAVIGGDGDMKEALLVQAQSLGIAEQIQWSGWVENSDAFYKKLHLFCLPSRNETFGIVMLEALARGLPAVATRTAGVKSLLGERDVALTVPVEDAAALADALTRALQEWPQSCAKGMAGRAWVQEKYDIQIVAKDLQHFLQRLISQWQPNRKGDAS